MRTDPNLTLAEAVAAARDGEDLLICCPSHEDGVASLHVSHSTEAGVLLYCHAGCQTRYILDASGLSFADLAATDAPPRTERRLWTPQGEASHVYPYTDEAGALLYEVLRVPQPGGRKTFMQRRPTDDPDRPYEWKLGEARRVPYRLPQTLAAIRDGHLVYVTEGEKDAEALVSRGYPATCNSGGAGKWREEFGALLAGARVAVVQDADDPGRAHGRAVADNLREHGCVVSILESPAPHKDVADLFAAGADVAALLTVVPFDERGRAKTGIDVLDLVRRDRTAIEWVQPFTMARRERLLLVGLEGQGKSTLLRQMAVQAAAGVHWWSLRPVPPVRVLVIDGENEPDQYLASWQELVRLADATGRPVRRGQLTVLEEWDSTIHLDQPEGTAWLAERVHGYMPDLLFLGPLSNFVSRDLKDDEPVRRLKDTINAIRRICGSAVVMEHHAPHRTAGDKTRAVRPYGSSMFLRWPDYGYGMVPHTGDQSVYWWEKVRWPRVRGRSWPEGLRWGVGTWPWVECVPPEEPRKW